MESIKDILIRRDKMSPEEADACIEEATEQMYCYLSNNETDLAGDICQEYFGLEPDYIMELI